MGCRRRNREIEEGGLRETGEKRRGIQNGEGGRREREEGGRRKKKEKRTGMQTGKAGRRESKQED
jgi:hypothetical protein